MSLKLAGSVILYNPKEADLQNINSYLFAVDALYIYDNSAQKMNSAFITNNPKIHYYWDGENYGLSIRLNQACKKAISDGYEYLLTMDQDSSFLKENLNKYLKDISEFKSKQITAMYGLEYSYEDQIYNNDSVDYKIEGHIITSGAIVNLNLFETIGGFDENLFIDGVDIDYCFAAKAKGFNTIQFKNNYLKHSLGEPVRRASIETLYLIKRNKIIHSPIRLYYMQRNIMYLEKKYASLFPELIESQKKTYLHHINKCIKFSPNLIKALRFKWRAIKDFKSNAMGKFID